MKGALSHTQLKLWRKLAKTTQKETAAMLDIPLATYKSYENGRVPIPGVVGVALTGLSLAYLVKTESGCSGSIADS